MPQDALEIDAAIHPRLTEAPIDLHDAEALRLVLAGGSVIDWHKAAFPDRASVDRLLRLHLLDPTDANDLRRLRYVFHEAVSYVEEFRGMRLPPELRDPTDVRDVFLWASDTSGFRRRQMLSCMLLKLMHVISHLEAADLKLRASTSEYELLRLAHHEVVVHADAMRKSGVPLVAFYGSRKTRASIIQKLLAKRDNIAATIFDKLRYRLVVPTRDDILPALTWLLRYVVPFNHVLPGQSHNNLVSPDALLAHLPPEDHEALQPDTAGPVQQDTTKNEFSGSTYRMINFIADLPVRLPNTALPGEPDPATGRIVFALVEFQLVDQATADANECGENAHDRYKERQWERVKDRLGRGAYPR